MLTPRASRLAARQIRDCIIIVIVAMIVIVCRTLGWFSERTAAVRRLLRCLSKLP